MFFISASFLEFIAVNYLARLNQLPCPLFQMEDQSILLLESSKMLKNINFCFLIETLCCARWVQDPDQQKKKKENAILDVSKILRVFEFCAILHVKKSQCP